MARKLRVEYEGALYHVMNRGDHREAIFLDDEDRQSFIATLGEACAKTGWQVHALCLMDNHFHLVVETPQANLVAGMKWLLGTYTGRFNRRHKFFGHLFSGRYKALIVDGSDTDYWGSITYPRTARRAVVIWSASWSSAALRSPQRIIVASVEAGVWGMPCFGRNCSARLLSGRGRSITARNGERARRKRRKRSSQWG